MKDWLYTIPGVVPGVSPNLVLELQQIDIEQQTKFSLEYYKLYLLNLADVTVVIKIAFCSFKYAAY